MASISLFLASSSPFFALSNRDISSSLVSNGICIISFIYCVSELGIFSNKTFSSSISFIIQYISIISFISSLLNSLDIWPFFIACKFLFTIILTIVLKVSFDVNKLLIVSTSKFILYLFDKSQISKVETKAGKEATVTLGDDRGYDAEEFDALYNAKFDTDYMNERFEEGENKMELLNQEKIEQNYSYSDNGKEIEVNAE